MDPPHRQPARLHHARGANVHNRPHPAATRSAVFVVALLHESNQAKKRGFAACNPGRPVRLWSSRQNGEEQLLAWVWLSRAHSLPRFLRTARTEAGQHSGIGSSPMRPLFIFHELAYRLRLKNADPLSLTKRTVWLAPRTTMWITPEIEYSLL